MADRLYFFASGTRVRRAIVVTWRAVRPSQCTARSVSAGIAALLLAACGGGSGQVVKNTQADTTVTEKDGIGKLALTGCVGFDYLAAFNVGGQTMNLLLDSGSTTFGVAGAQCANCTVQNGVATTYRQSSTAKKTGFSASSTYVDGSGWRGVILNDGIAAGDTSALVTPAVPVNFADIVTESAFFEQVSCAGPDDIAFDGIAGVGPDEQLLPNTTSFMTQLAASQKMAADIFSLQMCDVGGYIWFGGFDPASMTATPNYTPIVSSAANPGYFVNVADISLGGTSIGVDASKLGPMVVDSGTNALYLTKSAYAGFVPELQANAAYQANFPSDFITGTEGCRAPSKGLTRAQLDAQLPTLAIRFPGVNGSSFSIEMTATNSYLVAYVQSGTTYYCPAIAGGSTDDLAILGNAALRQFITIFDRANQQIGFAPQTGCQQASLYVAPQT